MHLLANENFPALAVEALREKGHDVAWVRTDAPGSSDRDVLWRAQKEKRIVATFDKDFGELAFRHGLPSACGVLLFRISTASPQEASDKIVAALESRSDWEGNFAVIEESRIRIKSLVD